MKCKCTECPSGIALHGSTLCCLCHVKYACVCGRLFCAAHGYPELEHHLKEYCPGALR